MLFIKSDLPLRDKLGFITACLVWFFVGTVVGGTVVAATNKIIWGQ